MIDEAARISLDREALMPSHSFAFDSIIYNGFDNVRDGIGNHLSLFDRLIFDELSADRKSLAPVPSQFSPDRYDGVLADWHLENPNAFKNALFLDIARETWNPAGVRQQMERTIRHKRVFNAVTAVYLMWESDRLWDLYADMISAYDFCIVTSDILAEFLDDRGIDWLKLPHPYDFACIAPARTRGQQDDPVRFGISAGLWRRKNVALLAAEFVNAFGNDAGAELSIHTRSDIEHDDFRSECEAIERLRDGGARIELINESLPREEYLDWMRSLDVYCFVSAGEGYSITPREALHLGVPVLLHDAHVHAEFSHLPGVVRVPSAGLQPARPNTASAACDIGSDWRIDADALRGALRYCLDHHASLKKRLAERCDEVRKLHDMDEIRSAWIDRRCVSGCAAGPAGICRTCSAECRSCNIRPQNAPGHRSCISKNRAKRGR
ncbi:MAG: glycosyltransferase family 1 protein [Proteobacteria bacterium]|nr:MAG: glycosyltransferase family 1 protein [Pseudomonadota bacterium]